MKNPHLHKIMKKSQLRQIIREEISRVLNEQVKMATSIINGKTITSNIAGETGDLKEFEKLIMNIPDTVKSVKVQSDTSVFNPSSKEFKDLNDAKRSEIIDIVRDVTSQYEAKGETIEAYELRGYFGVRSTEVNDPFYIQYRTKKSQDFADRMGRGEYGSLD